MPRVEYFDGHTLEVSIGVKRYPGPGTEMLWWVNDTYRDNGFEPKNGIVGESGRINIHMDPFLLTTDTVVWEMGNMSRLLWVIDAVRNDITRPDYSQFGRGRYNHYQITLPQPVVTPYVLDRGHNIFTLGFGWISDIDRNLYTVRGFVEGWSAHGERWEEADTFDFEDGQYEYRSNITRDAGSYRFHIKAYFRNRTPVVSEAVTFISRTLVIESSSFMPLGLMDRRRRYTENRIGSQEPPFWQELERDALEPVTDEDVLGDPWIEVPGLPPIHIPTLPGKVAGQLLREYEKGLVLFHISSGGDYSDMPELAEMSRGEAIIHLMAQSTLPEGTEQLPTDAIDEGLKSAFPTMIGYIAYVPRQGTRYLMENVGSSMIHLAENTTTSSGLTDATLALALTVGMPAAMSGLYKDIIPETNEKPGGGNAADAAFIIGNSAVRFSDSLNSKEATDLMAAASVFRAMKKIPGATEARKAVPDGDGLTGIMEDSGEIQREGVTDDDITDDVVAQTKEEMARIQAEYEASRENGIGALIGWLFPEDAAIKMIQKLGWHNYYKKVEDYYGETTG